MPGSGKIQTTHRNFAGIVAKKPGAHDGREVSHLYEHVLVRVCDCVNLY
jgi:hypothetical protein